ncbi:hypothetical protein MA03_02445 [Infirmifilum uzonense]|uniref:HTH marR-type domain-containing protein n=1 Tax=Infirmifilum uzonense TaxID=1550241 RepID=A0A0F7FGR9_9CREN|nr:MarR family transcriptional regulator [Infirmifilum uzonense]AKG38358.1 hypothetical protein MA03_02445 [Infirmifilum uzonense]
MSEEEFEVLFEILRSPHISVNKLYQRMKGRISKARLIKILRNLNKEGFLKVERDPRHKQKLHLRVSEDVERLAGSLMGALSTLRDTSVANQIESLLNTYHELASRVTRPELRDFLRSLIKRQVDSLITNIL